MTGLRRRLDYPGSVWNGYYPTLIESYFADLDALIGDIDTH
jgi:hypothetical protein